jgi:DNA-binding NarL/FixJ family response regulator
VKNAAGIRILIVDDHPVVRSGLVALFDSQPDMTVVASAADGIEAVEMVRRHAPDVALMDLRMPVMGGVEAIRAIKGLHASCHVIVLTTYDGDEDIYQAIEAGAQGYLLKAAPEAELFQAVRQVHAGYRYLPAGIARALESRTPNSDLTPRERQILALIAKGLSNRAIGNALGISEGTVKCHVNTILARLGVADRTQAAVTALQRGLVHW